MFINIPNNYSSMWGELIYEYNSTDDTNLVVQLRDDMTDEIVAVKKFYSTSDLKLNVAPLLFNSMIPQASYSTSGVATCERGFPKISLIIGSESSSSRRFTYASGVVEPPLLLTTMPTGRMLSAHQCDSLTILLPEESTFAAAIKCSEIGGDGTMESVATWSSSAGGAICVTINADDYCQFYDQMSVILWCDSTQFAEVNYALSADQAAGYRVAWISTQGSIEHYTFPIIEEQVRLNSGATTYSLRSAYGTAHELEALAEILSSPTIWRADEDSYTTIELLTTELTMRSEGALMVANFKISENG